MHFKKFILIIAIGFLFSHTLTAQDINWRGENKKHFISGYFGADYSSYYGLSHGLLLHAHDKPIVLGNELTLAFGEDNFDDWRWRTSLQTEVLQSGNFSMTIKPGLILRRYESPMARMYNVAADVTIVSGFLKPKWGVAGLLNYDKSISTHIVHGKLKDSYPKIVDGWYRMSGGNFKVGARVNVAIGSFQSYLTLGKHFGHNLKDNPTLPFFFEFSLQKMF